MRIAVYGKGGIGKSTIASNLSYAISKKGHRVLQIGCDPKSDSTRALLKGKVQTTVTEYMRQVPPSKRKLEDIVNIGSEGVMCIEAGGPKPGVGCAGKGIVGMFQTLERMDYSSLGADTVIYDVLGDVVCGGFAVPMRTLYSDSIIIVTSGEYMSLFAANNIMKGSLSFEQGRGRVAGMMLNRRGVANEDSIVDEFSRATGVPVIGRIGRTDDFRRAEAEGKTVSELLPDSESSVEFRRIADTILRFDANHMVSPTPLTDLQMDALYSTGRCEGRGEFREADEQPAVVMKAQADIPIRRIGKGPVSAVLEGGKVMDIPVVIHGTDSCGYTMLCEVSTERMRHIMEDPDAFVSAGRNITCTGMTSEGSVFGGARALKKRLDSLCYDNKVILVISTCLPGMIGDDCERTISDVSSRHPGTKILYVDANRVDSGFDAHVEVIREFSKLIDPSIEPLDYFVNLVDDTFITINRGRNKRNIDLLLSCLDLVRGPGFLDDTCIDDIVSVRRYGIAVLGDMRRDNLTVRGMLEAKGIRFMDRPLPRGYSQTLEWIDELSEITGKFDRGEILKESVRSEFTECIDRYSKDMDGMKIMVITNTPSEDSWMAEDLSSCGCRVEVSSSQVDVSGYDLIIDCMGVLKGERTIRAPTTFLTHLAAIDLIRYVRNLRLSKNGSGWRCWNE